MEEEFLCPLPCVTVDRIGVCHSISLIYIAHVASIIHHNLGFYGHPIVIAEITLCWCIVYVCQNTYVALFQLYCESAIYRAVCLFPSIYETQMKL